MLISQQRITPRVSDVLSTCLPQSKLENENLLRKYIPKRHQYWAGSGREALRQILSNLNKQKVGLPAYTCHVVLDTIKRAGKTPVFYDSGVIAEVDEIKKIIKDVDVLIVCYNFGFLPEIDKIAKLCRKNNVILIEDCAQALGATYKTSQGQQLAGSFGDYAFYSFGISKNIGFCGGLIVSNNPLKITTTQKYPLTQLFKAIVEASISPLFFNKFFYPFTKRLLFSELHKNQPVFDYSCPLMAQKIILHQLRRYNGILQQRKINAEYCIKEIENMSNGANIVYPLNASSPAWLYFVLLTDDREKVKSELLKKNVEVGEMTTFRCLGPLDNNSKNNSTNNSTNHPTNHSDYPLAKQTEQQVLTFALYRETKEIKQIIKKIGEIK